MKVLISTVALCSLVTGAVHAGEVRTAPATPGPVPLTDAQADRITAGAQVLPGGALNITLSGFGRSADHSGRGTDIATIAANTGGIDGDVINAHH